MKTAEEHVYSSGDFGKTKAEIEVIVPERLLHKNVIGGRTDSEFSADRQHPVYVVELPSRAVSMTIGGMEGGGQTRRHRHTYETLIYVLRGCGHTMVEDRRVDWEAGDALLVPRWAWHQHFNDSPTEYVEYIGCENAPMLQNIGLALREEAKG